MQIVFSNVHVDFAAIIKFADAEYVPVYELPLVAGRNKPFYAMFRNYLKIAWRNLLRYKAFSLINILGLSIGIATCTIIFLYVRHEMTYDRQLFY